MNIRNLIKHPNHVEIIYTEKDSPKEKVMKKTLDSICETFWHYLAISPFEKKEDLRAHHIQYLVGKGLIHLIA